MTALHTNHLIRMYPQPHPREFWQVAAGLGLCEAELSNCSVADVLRGQHAAPGAVGADVVGGGEPTAADLPAAALSRVLKVCQYPALPLR